MLQDTIIANSTVSFTMHTANSTINTPLSYVYLIQIIELQLRH